MLANYAAEQRTFRSLISSTVAPNVLLLHGPGGSGKSALLHHVIAQKGTLPAVTLDLKGSANTGTIASLFDLAGTVVGWSFFQQFTKTVATLLPDQSAAADPAWITSMRRYVLEATAIGDLDSRLSIYRPLTESWLADLARLGRPILLTIDGYEAASLEFVRWIEEQFLDLVTSVPVVRLVISGRTVPKHEPGLGDSARAMTLDGIKDSGEWLTWAQAIGYRVGDQQYLKGVVDALNGQPLTIASFIQSNLPLSVPAPAAPPSEAAVEPAEPMSVSERRRFRRNLIEYFSMTQVKTICFDLGINHERLPGDGSLDGLVLELLAYINRRPGLIPNFATICRDERPDLPW